MTGLLRRVTRWLTQARSFTYQDLVDDVSAVSDAGIAVSPEAAIRCTAVFAAVRVIAETIASIPLRVYERMPDGAKRPAREHRLYRLLHDRPHPAYTSFQFRELLTSHVLLYGNGFAIVERDGSGRVTQIVPVLPHQFEEVELRWDREAGAWVKWYTFRLPRPGGTEVVRRYHQDEVLHVVGLGYDGLVGYSPIRVARNAVGIALVAEQYGAKFFGQGALPGGVLEFPGRLSPEARERLRVSWQQIYGGPRGAFKTAILEDGLTYKPLTIPPDDAQFIETRKFQVEEIARLYRVPPHLLAHLERATYSNVEQQSIEFVVHTIRPWCVRWESELNTKLFSLTRESRYFAEFSLDGLLRGDIESRYRAYAVGRQWGWLSANDIRRLENLNPIDGGDTYLVPLNMAPAEQQGQGETKQQAAPPPASGDSREMARVISRLCRHAVAKFRQATLAATKTGKLDGITRAGDKLALSISELGAKLQDAKSTAQSLLEEMPRDREALGAWWQEHEDRVYRMLRAMCPGGRDDDD